MRRTPVGRLVARVHGDRDVALLGVLEEVLATLEPAPKERERERETERDRKRDR